MKLLIIDDQPITSYVIDKLLKFDRPETELISLTNGKEAIYWFENEYEPIDMILLDMFMPVLDGRSFIDWYSSTEFSKSIPMVIYSTMMKSSNEEIINSHPFIIDQVEKPISIDVLEHLEEKAHSFKDEE